MLNIECGKSINYFSFEVFSIKSNKVGLIDLSYVALLKVDE